jgi:acyl carrier protein
MNDTLREIFANQGRLGGAIEGLADDADLFSAGLDSLAIVSVMLAVEDRFDVEIPDAFLNRSTFASIAVLSSVLRQLQAERGSQ